MHSYFAPLPFFSILLLTIMVFTDPPVSIGAAIPEFTNCSRAFECGNIKNITYPFWGNGRAEYCGQPDFRLNCQHESVQMGVKQQSYRVLSINTKNQTLRMAMMSSWSGNCPSKFVNVSLPSNLFNYSIPSTQNITLFYDCPLIPQVINNTFSCSRNHTSTSPSYFWVHNLPMAPPPPDLWKCNISIVLPVLQKVVDNFTRSQSTLEEVVKNGFDVGYAADISTCNECESTGGQCGYDSKTKQENCFCYNGIYIGTLGSCILSNFPSKSAIEKRLIILLVGFVLLIILICCGRIILICCWRRIYRLLKSLIFWKRNKKAQRLVESFLKSYGSLAPKRYSYSEIKKITRSFEDKIGQGGYGGVYKGKLLDGRLVAVKLLNKDRGDGEEFINEVASISRTSHVNVVSLLGFCFDGSKRALIYEFMANGSLEKFMYDQNSLEAQSHLGWETLNKITIGVARGLEYLHRGCNTRILHFDIKPHNILLDENFIPKISDFGLAKLCPGEESIIPMSGARGTAGYVAPEVFSRNFGGVSHKSDVYSFGMMVLDTVGGRKNNNVVGDNGSSTETYFPQWIYKRLELDENLVQGNLSKEEGEITRKMILVALWCIQTNPVDRPAMTKVVEMLEGSLELLSVPPKPYLCSPPRSPVSSSTT